MKAIKSNQKFDGRIGNVAINITVTCKYSVEIERSIVTHQ